MELTREELELIKESLEYTKRAFENYKDYPSYEFKCQRIKEVRDLMDKISAMKRGER